MKGYGKGDSSWFTHDRFGMFIHWGLYSMPARHEWIRNRELIANEDYQKYFDNFDPDLFNASEWAKAAREAGMKYVVFTAKHHEGFCMFDSALTDYKSTNLPCKRDFVREITDAFRAEGLHVGLYYSLLDWHHPDFTIDWFHPLSRRPDRDELNKTRNMAKYRDYMQGQTRELLTKYGDIDILWYDFSYPVGEYCAKGRNEWGSEELVKLIRSLRPSVLLDNRLDLPGAGDIMTPEQNVPDEPLRDENGNPVVWEGCQTFSGSWGYFRDELTWKSEKQCIDLLINHVSRGGNLLMNVGPTSRGFIDSRAMTRLQAYARWMKLHSKSIYGCGIAPEEFPEPRDCRYTYNPEKKKLYLHIMNWPFGHITLKNLAGKIAYAQFLHDGSEVLMRESTPAIHTHLMTAVPPGGVALQMPVNKPDTEVPVIELILK
jgi:alpha-L-fucosidase